MKKRLPGTSLCCALGACGAIACSIAMFAAPLGILGASVTAGAKADSMQSMGAMAGMSPTASAAAAAAHVPAWIALLNLFGPQLLIVSVVLVIAALAVRRSVFGALAAVAAGMLLYYGMYAQGNMNVMWSATGVGLVLLLSSMIGMRRRAAPERI